MPLNDAVRLLEMPEHDAISVIVDAGHDELLALGERINDRWDLAYMNGYNWEVLIHAWTKARDPQLEAGIEADPEGDMYSGVMTHSVENIDKMRRFERLVKELLADEAALFSFIETNDLPWD